MKQSSEEETRTWSRAGTSRNPRFSPQRNCESLKELYRAKVPWDFVGAIAEAVTAALGEPRSRFPSAARILLREVVNEQIAEQVFLLSLLRTTGHAPRRLRDLPRECLARKLQRLGKGE